MSALIGAVVVLLLGFAGARFTFSAGGSSTGPRFLITAGAHFLLVGWLLGPQVIGLLGGETLSELSPLVLLGVGWAGVLFGLQFDRESFAAVPARHLAAALVQAVVAFAVFLLLASIVVRVADVRAEAAVPLVLLAAASACVSGPLATTLLAGALRTRGPAVQLAALATRLDGLVGIAVLQVTFSVFDPRGTGFRHDAQGVAGWLLLGSALGLVFGVVFLLLTRMRPGFQEAALVLMGTVVFLTGAAAFLGVSPLFTATLAGIVVGNLSPMRRRLSMLMHDWEKPIQLMLLMLVGSLLDLTHWWVFALGMAYALMRAVSKVAAAGAMGTVAGVGTPRLLGAGFIAQGGIALVVALSAAVSLGALAPGVGRADLYLTVVAVAMVLSDLVAPRVARTVLARDARPAEER